MSNEDFDEAEQIRQQLTKTPGLLANPFGAPESAQVKDKAPQFVAGRGTTPGQLVDPFKKQPKGRGRKKVFPMNVAPKKVTQQIQKRKILVDPGPYWWQAAKAEIDVAMAKGITEEWIKKVTTLLTQVLVPPSFRITTQEVEVAIILESEEHLKMIIETQAASFDPIRHYHKTFLQLTKKQRQEFWAKLAQTVLDRLK